MRVGGCAGAGEQGVVGEGLDVLLFGLGGYFFGDQLQSYGSSLTHAEFAIVILTFLTYWFFTSRRK